MNVETLSRKIRAAHDVRRTYKNWPRWLINRMGMHPGGPFTEIRVNGSRLLAPNNAESWGIADQVWRWKVYTKHFPILDHYRVLDVGAHFGFFSIFAGHQARGVKVASYEPSQSTFEILAKNLSRNLPETNTFAFNFGLGDRSGDMAFYKPQGHDASGTLFKRNLGETTVPILEERVRIEDGNRIWELFDRYDFAKLDCEGSEFAILRCLGDQVQRLHYLVLEYHDNPEEIVQFLSSKNFSILEILPLETDARWNGLSHLGMLYARNDQYRSE